MTRSFGMIDRQAIANGLLRPIARRPSALIVWVVYAAHAGPEATAFVSNQLLIEATGLTKEAVRKGRLAAQKAKLLVPTGRRRCGCAVYWVARTGDSEANCIESGRVRKERSSTVVPTGVDRAGNGRWYDQPTSVGPNRRKNRQRTDQPSDLSPEAIFARDDDDPPRDFDDLTEEIQRELLRP